jgi:hypothetical protein
MDNASLKTRCEAGVGSERSRLTGGTYKYRDPVKRRAQVAAAMRRSRARKARRGGVGSG